MKKRAKMSMAYDCISQYKLCWNGFFLGFFSFFFLFFFFLNKSTCIQCGLISELILLSANACSP